MKDEIEKYKNINMIAFSIDISQKQHKNGNFKKDIIYPKGWKHLVYKIVIITLNIMD